jgi:transcriptional regulator with XRE-family HTH domain
MCYTPTMSELIDRLKEIKKKTGLSQEAIAREIGVSLPTVTRWFKGKFEPNVHVRPKVEDFVQKHS